MTLRFIPENGGNPRFLQNGVPEHRVYFPPNELPDTLYRKLAPFTANKNLRRGTVTAHENGLYVENSRITAQGYTPGMQEDIPKEQIPPDGWYVQLPYGQTMEWGYLTHYTEPQALLIASPQRAVPLQSPTKNAPQDSQEQETMVRVRREKIRKTLIRFAREIRDENQDMTKRSAWKQAVQEYDRDYGIPWFRPDLRLRRRALLALALGLSTVGVVAGDYVLNSYPHSGQQLNMPPATASSTDLKIDGIELPNNSIKLENLENPTGNTKYAALTVTVLKGMSLVLFVHNGTTQDVGVFPLSNPKNAHDDLTNWRKKRAQSGTPIYKQDQYFPTTTDIEILILNQIHQDATDLVLLQGDSLGNAPQFVARLASSSNEAKQIAREIMAKYSLGNVIPVTKDDYPQTYQNDPGFK